MKKAVILLILLLFGWLGNHPLPAQDFMMLGCFWDCPDDAVEIDPASLNFWVEKVKGQAPELQHAGFRYLWLPAFYTEQQQLVAGLIGAMRVAGLEPILDVDLYELTGPSDTLAYPLGQVHRLWTDLKVRGFRLISERDIRPLAVSGLLSRLQTEGEIPQLFIVRTREKQSPSRLANFVNTVEGAAPSPDVDTRVFDYPLREALRRACNHVPFDVRQVFESSIRDATTLSGYKIITLVNSPEFYNSNGTPGDSDDLITDPLLAYAYILTNNQLGLPSVFYGDYFGPESEIEYFLERPALKNEIDQLIKAHREFIVGSNAVEYLNRLNTDRASHYITGSASQTLIFQMDGSLTPAGQAAGHARDVLVAVNFSDTTLKVVHEINLSNANDGDTFTDVLGRSTQTQLTVANNEAFSIPNAVYLELPPRSYSIWVQGEAERITAGPIDFSAESIDDYVELNWEVSGEASIRGYQVERSINGGKFQKVTWVDALGVPNEATTYLFVDEDVFPGEKIRYRIRALGRTGRTVAAVARQVRLPAELCPFEVTSEGSEIKTVRIRSNADDEATLMVFNAEGRQLLTDTQALKRGLNLSRIDLSAYPKGIYFIKVSSTRNRKWTERIVHL